MKKCIFAMFFALMGWGFAAVDDETDLKITFVEKIPDAGENPRIVTGSQCNADGSYDEYWVGNKYEFYLAALKPGADGTYSLCTETCNGLKVHLGSMTSPKIVLIPDEVEFKDGYATVTVRSLAEYRWDIDPAIHYPATIAVVYNDYVQAIYSPIYFRNTPATPATPAPLPIEANVFDADKDGIQDSVVITYERAIHRDSLPTKICVLWDEASAQVYNPYQEGFSTNPNDVALSCNALVSYGAYNIDCMNMTEVDGIYGYCSDKINLGGLKLSSSVKTSGVGKVYSYTVIQDKGKNIKLGYNCDLVNPNASASLRSKMASLKYGLSKYSVMDLQGRVVRQGLTAEAEPVIRNIAPGSYIVKIGANAHRVNIR